MDGDLDRDLGIKEEGISINSNNRFIKGHQEGKDMAMGRDNFLLQDINNKVSYLLHPQIQILVNPCNINSNIHLIT